MKFVDEAFIKVQAGKGGDGSASFLREKYVPFGGPDGGDGGRGGHIYLLADPGLNTLVDFRYKTQFIAKNGQPGAKRQCAGANGQDLVIKVPLGTLVKDVSTGELLGDLVAAGDRLLVAEGGARGLGNVNFKSATNRAPRKITRGKPGDSKKLLLELKLLAQVGLLGLPNAGKSTLVQAVSGARPKVADYPFTTLHPQLGVVDLPGQRRFVITDIPGLVPGAAEGKGLGIQFLKHLSRTTLLLHMVDLHVVEETALLEEIRVIERELHAFSETLYKKPRWLVFNKMDCMAPEEGTERVARILKALDYQGPWFIISALTRQGTSALCEKAMQHLQAEQPETEELIEPPCFPLGDQ